MSSNGIDVSPLKHLFKGGEKDENTQELCAWCGVEDSASKMRKSNAIAGEFVCDECVDVDNQEWDSVSKQLLAPEISQHMIDNDGEGVRAWFEDE